VIARLNGFCALSSGKQNRQVAGTSESEERLALAASKITSTRTKEKTEIFVDSN
jgi:hypothetical protein